MVQCKKVKLINLVGLHGYLGAPREYVVFHVNLDSKPSLRLLQFVYYTIELQMGTFFSLGNFYMYK